MLSQRTLFLVILAWALELTRTVLATSEQCPLKRPNFVIIMSDDQDLHLNSLAYQPAVQKHFADDGLTFKKHFCTMAQCCPSRVSLWTGMAGHNTNVTDIRPPFGMQI
jgi:arylsulfatase A-like enzyme